MRRVTVVGSGIAGTAAAIVAASRGAEVTLIDGGVGATVLAPGALDDDALWTHARGARALHPLVALVLEKLAAYHVPDAVPVVVATAAGIVRPARGRDRAVLDLSALSETTVLVPRMDQPTWDGAALARTWSDARFARERRLAFVAIPAQLTRLVDERDLPDADLAERHDAPERLAWMGSQIEDAIRRAGGPVGAVLLPSWLGIERERAGALSDRLGIPCGEALSSPGGPSGLRFERARNRSLTAARVQVTRARVTRLAASGGARVELESGATIEGDAVVLATGGLVGGGLEYTPGGAVSAAAVPPGARPTFHVTIDAGLTLSAFGRSMELPGSLFGAPPETHAWPFAADSLLEHAGVAVDEDGKVRGLGRIYAAGELVADRPRTWLDAALSGARAGARAAT